MITFADARERELLADLREAGLVTPVVLESIHSALGRAENPSFEDFLLAGAASINESNWLSWLIRRQGCFRFGPVKLQETCPIFEDDAPRANLPYRRLESGRLLYAILRPDLAVDGYRAAATLHELRQLRIDLRTPPRHSHPLGQRRGG